VSKPPANSNRGRFYLWCRQQGRWNQEVAGLDPATQNKLFDPYCPARNVTKRYPPTMLLHGDADTDVPFEQSEQMERVLRREGVEVEFIRMPGGAHGFDGRPEAQGVAEAFGKVLVFLRRQLR
jgi:dipeptidyl aminopeptidase/acylaminoacyl peptidase